MFSDGPACVWTWTDLFCLDPEFAQWVQPLIQRLIPILLHPKSPKSLTENAAVTIGRLALVQPDIVSPHLEVFAQPWCVIAVPGLI
jgi:hypothetical protein